MSRPVPLDAETFTLLQRTLARFQMIAMPPSVVVSRWHYFGAMQLQSGHRLLRTDHNAKALVEQR
jgi:hypothetical protein